MSLDIPINIDEIDSSPQAFPTKTPLIDFESGRIVGYCDDLEAMAQAVKLALLTPRFRFLVFDNQFGSEVEELVSSQYDELLFISEAKRRVKDALLCDNRITDVYDFDFSDYKNSKTIRFSVDTIFGSLHKQEVNLSV